MALIPGTGTSRVTPLALTNPNKHVSVSAWGARSYIILLVIEVTRLFE